MFGLVFLYASWLPFLLVAPWLRRRDAGALRLALVPIGVGGAIALYTAISFRLWPHAAIRIDLLFLMPIVWLADVAGIFGLVAALRRSSRVELSRGVRSLALAAAFGSSGFAVAWVVHQLWFAVEMRELSARIEDRRELLLGAKFRDRRSFELAFGSIEGERPWVGYWAIQDDDRVRRLVINRELQAWVYAECGESECEAGPAQVQAAAGEGRAHADVSFTSPGATFDLELVAEGSDRLRITRRAPAGSGKAIALSARRAPPPEPRAPPSRPVKHLGAFSWIQELPQHRALTQLELWREEDRLFGFLIRTTAVRGQEILVFPLLLDEIEIDPDGGWFHFDSDRGPVSGKMLEDGVRVELTDAHGERRQVRLERRARVDHPVFRLAPRTSYQDWVEWAQTVVALARISWSPGAPRGAP